MFLRQLLMLLPILNSSNTAMNIKINFGKKLKSTPSKIDPAVVEPKNEVLWKKWA